VGLKRVNISLDTLKPERFKAITRVGSLDGVFQGIEAAQKAGLAPIKINAVVMQGVNDDEVADLARLSVERDLHVRFIELMPFTDVHCSLGQGEVKATFVPYRRVMEEVEKSLGKLEVAKPPLGNGPARYYRLPGAPGTVGFISPWSQEHFCMGCNRLRLTSQGKLRPCLLTDLETDLRSALRVGASRQELKELILHTVQIKPEGHSLARGRRPRKRTMTQIGG